MTSPATTMVLLAALFAGDAQAAEVPSSVACAPDALVQASKLLAFHFDDDNDSMHVADAATPLPSIVNPGNRRQRFDVLQVWGYVYKGKYRMRFEFYRLPDGGCVLMGQEILQYATL